MYKFILILSVILFIHTELIICYYYFSSTRAYHLESEGNDNKDNITGKLHYDSILNSSGLSTTSVIVTLVILTLTFILDFLIWR
jgi:ABC-type sugar transport system permease subunit